MEDLVANMVFLADTADVAVKILNGLLVVLGLGLVIFFHELGHFMVAKWCNVHVERFSIGIGPILWSRQKGETEYALSALPFGGYVKMLGQDDMDANQMTSDEIAENPRAYSAKSVPQRMAIISAGVIMNVLTGFLFYVICYRIGVKEESPIIGSVAPGFPAWNAGLRAGDRITAVNGDEIRSFHDVFNAVVLSSGSVRVQGVHDDGTEFDETLTPDRGEVGRSIGVHSSMTTQLNPAIADDKMIVMSGLPSVQASAPFHAGDQLLSVNGQEMKSFSELQEFTAKHASEELTYLFRRTSPESSGNSEPTTSEVAIRVPPAEIKAVGLWMTMGPVKAVRKGSIAENSGLKIGDKITHVDGMAIGKDYDALRLPIYFAEHAGQDVTIKIEREAPATGSEKITITLKPDDTPGWSERPLFQTSPLPIPAIGAAYQVLPWISRVVPGSEAELSGKFREGQKVLEIALEHPDPANIVPDGAGDKTTPPTINLAELEKRQPGNARDINWANAFEYIQQAPERHVRLYIQDGDNKTFSHVLTERTGVPGWYLWMRGINGWASAVEIQKAETIGGAVALGVRKTKNTGVSIYMTLRSLIRRDIPTDALSGPLGIVNIGYKVAARGVTELLLFLAFLSINLAVINFLPIPVLDGGHMVFLIWEGVSRRKPNAKVIGWAHGFGLLFIISLFAFVMYLDIFVNKLGSGG